MRNVEIKAKIQDPKSFVAKLKELGVEDGVVIKQHDTFFTSANGRLKLREFEDGTSELIYYERPNITGPKLCDYKKTTLNAEATGIMKEILTSSNGIFGIVKKTRQLYMIGQTRVHVDEVDGLGSFMELEVVLSNEAVQDGEKIAQDLMHKLNIQQKDLISEAYIDLLSKLKSA